MLDSILEEILKLDRQEIRVSIKRLFITRQPELLSRLDNRLMKDVQIYLEGYSCAFKENISEPYNKEDILDFLYEEGYRYALKRLSKD